MKIGFERTGETLKIKLGAEYNLFTLSSIHELLNSEKEFHGITKVLVDCTNLEYVDSFGGEIFLIRERFNITRIEFINLNDKLYDIFNLFSLQLYNENIIISNASWQ